MTIAIDCRCLQGGQGGIDVYTRCLLNEMFALAPHHRFIIFFNGAKPFKHGLQKHDNVTVVMTRIPSKIFHCSLFLFRRPFLNRWIERYAKERLDILFAPNLHFFSVSKGTKVIATLHDLSFIHYRSLMNIRSRIWHHCANIVRFASLTERIIAVSESTRCDLECECIVSPDRMSVIPLGIDSRFFNHDSEQQQPMILAFCPQERRKNIMTLVRAFARACELDSRAQTMKLVIGGLSGHIDKELLHTIRHHRLSDMVRFIGYLSLDERMNLIKSSSLLVYPSIYEGFGLPPLEACAAGIPVIAAAHSSIMEVCGDAIWYVDPYNSEQMGQAIVHCLFSKQVRCKARTHAPQQALRYTWRACALRTLEEFDRLYANRN